MTQAMVGGGKCHDMENDDSFTFHWLFQLVSLPVLMCPCPHVLQTVLSTGDTAEPFLVWSMSVWCLMWLLATCCSAADTGTPHSDSRRESKHDKAATFLYVQRSLLVRVMVNIFWDAKRTHWMSCREMSDNQTWGARILLGLGALWLNSFCNTIPSVIVIHRPLVDSHDGNVGVRESMPHLCPRVHY